MYFFTKEHLVKEAWKELVEGGTYGNTWGVMHLGEQMAAIADGDTEKMKEFYNMNNMEYFFKESNGSLEKIQNLEDEDKVVGFMWPVNNELSMVRMELQFLKSNSQTYISIGYKLIYVVLVVFTYIFMFTYIKRVVYMVFLTMIAPLVAMTYPIDKIHDGKAQAFNMWLKEYIFNLLIQPMHMVLYVMLIGSAIELATVNILYTAVALGFMIPAEKLLRKFFGFEKAQTPGMLAGAAGAALGVTALNKLFNKGGSKGGQSSGSNNNKSNAEEDNPKINMKDDLDKDKYLADGNGSIDFNQGTNPLGDSNVNNSNVALTPASADSDANGVNSSSTKTLGENGTRISGVNNQLTARNKKPKRTAKLSRSLGAAKHYYSKGMKDKRKNGKLGRNAIRMGTGLALGATTAAAGLALGIASGDPSKVLSYTAGAAAGGYGLGSAIPGKIADTVGVAGTVDTFKDEWHRGDEKYKQKQIDKKIKEAQKDYQLRMFIEDKLKDKDAAKEAMENVVPGCIRYGLTDYNEIAAIAQMKNDGISTEQAISAALYSRDYADGKNTNKLGSKADEELDKTLLNKANKNQYVTDENRAAEVARRTRLLMNKFNEYKFKD